MNGGASRAAHQRRRRKSQHQALENYQARIATRFEELQAGADSIMSRAASTTDDGHAEAAATTLAGHDTMVHCSAERWAQVFDLDPQPYLAAGPRWALWPSQTSMLALLEDREQRGYRAPPATVPWHGAMIANPAGLGKTVIVGQQVLASGQARVRSGDQRYGHPTIVVVPSHLLAQWDERLRQWFPASALAIHCVVPTGRQTARAAVEDVDVGHILAYIDIVLVTCDTLAAASVSPDPKVWAAPARGLYTIPWRRLVVDEADTIAANVATDRYAACHAFRAESRIYVSATPFRNATLAEMNASFAFLGVAPEDLIANEEDAARRNALMRHFHLCTATTTVFPIETRWLSFDNDDERRAYCEWAHVRARDPAHGLYLDGVLRRACQSTLLLFAHEDRARERQRWQPSRKFRAILEFCQRELQPHERAIVFNEWVQSLEELAHVLTAAGVSHVLFHRGLSIGERVSMIRTLLHTPLAQRPRLILMSVRLGGRGLDGLQHVANVVLFLSPNWNPAMETHACARVAREGQQLPTRFVKWVMLGTIEADMETISHRKHTRLGRYTRAPADDGSDGEEDDAPASTLMPLG